MLSREIVGKAPCLRESDVCTCLLQHDKRPTRLATRRAKGLKQETAHLDRVNLIFAYRVKHKYQASRSGFHQICPLVPVKNCLQLFVHPYEVLGASFAPYHSLSLVIFCH